jgi:hypothetical protein
VFGLEHNRLCDEFAVAHPEWDQERLFHEARKWYPHRLSTTLRNLLSLSSPNTTHHSTVQRGLA